MINKVNNKNQMNEELMDWIKEKRSTLDIPETKEILKKEPNKKPKGKCEICGINKAKEKCVKCKKSVCISCYFHLIGVCKRCVPKETAEKWKNERPDWEKVLGVEWVG